MNIIIPAMLLVFVVLALVVFAYLQGAVSKKSDIEKSRTLIYEETTGALINGINYTAPFVRHSIYEGMVVVAWLNNNQAYMLTDIVMAEVTTGMASNGVRYKGSGNGKHIDATVWLRSKESVLNALSEAGFNVRT